MLVLLLVFVIIFGALITYIGRQSNLSVNQGQEEQSFGLADTGVQYAVWLLGSSTNPSGPAGGGLTPQELCEAAPESAVGQLLVNHPVVNSGQNIGSFTLHILSADDAHLRVRSTGYDVDRPDICQAVEATIHKTADALFHVVRWDQLEGYPCAEEVAACEYSG